MINTEIPLAIMDSLINDSHNLQPGRSSFNKHVCNSLFWLISITFPPSPEMFHTEIIWSPLPEKLTYHTENTIADFPGCIPMENKDILDKGIP